MSEEAEIKLLGASLRSQIHNKALQVLVTYELDFNELVELLAYLLRERPKEKCRGLARTQVNNLVNPYLGRSGRAGLEKAHKACEDPKAVPDYVYEFVEEQLGYLYPELKAKAEAEAESKD